MTTCIFACFLVLSLTRATAQDPVTVKTWRFALLHGSLSIDLLSLPDGHSSLRIGPVAKTQEAPIPEQVESLKQVLREMPGLGYDPQKLTSLQTRIFAEDAREKLAYACVDSRDWHTSIQNKRNDKEQLVVNLLNQSGAYEPYNEAFSIYGLQAQVAEAQKVALIYFSSLPRRNSRDRSYGGTRVPGDASVIMRFSKVDPIPEQQSQ